MSDTMFLNLGCSDRVVPGFIGVDIVRPSGLPADAPFQQADLSGPWPWAESSIDEVVAFDVCEHIGDCDHSSTYCVKCKYRGGDVMSILAASSSILRHPLGRPHFMNELHRVLRPGARATIETPNASRGVGFACDPTHVTQWCLSSFRYFEVGAFAHTRLAESYGITAAFRVISLDESECSGEDPRERVWKIRAVLEAVKP